MRSRVFLLVLPMLLALAAPAFARGGETLDSILPEIRAQHPGRLSDAEPFTAADGSTHYRIKWMTPEGRILYFDADARRGRFSSSGDDGGNWHGGQDLHWRDDGDSEAGSSDDEDAGRRHRDWNGSRGDVTDAGDSSGQRRGSDGDWRDRHNGDWHDRQSGDWHGGDRGGWRHHHGDN